MRTVPYFGISTLSATLGASVLTVPLVACYFNTCSLISPLANLLTLWAVGFVFVGGLLAGGAACVWPGLGRVLAVPVTVLVQYVNKVVELMAVPNLSALSMECLLYRLWLVFLYLLLFAAVVIKGKKRPLLPVCMGVCTLTLAVLLMGIVTRMGDMLVAALDVGQGQSIALFQNNLFALVDCGGNRGENAGDIAADYFQSRGVSRLDFLILTHYHDDHANGVSRLLERMEVGKIFLPDVEEDSPLRQEILALARQENIEVYMVTQDLEITTDEGQFLRIYAPVEQAGESNELGLAVLADGGSFRALVTGDMGAAGEERLLKLAGLSQVELLVAGHHGSDTSTSQALLDAICPQLALISVGEGNTYGHPSPETVAKLETAGARVYRTDLDGTIEIRQ